MRNFFVKSTVETDPGKRVTVQEGTFDNTGIADGVADLIVMAQVCVSFYPAGASFWDTAYVWRRGELWP